MASNVLRLLALAGGLLILAGPAFAQGDAQVTRGQAVYAEQKCSVCHSIGGQGNRRGALDSVGTRLTAPVIRQWLTNAPEMALKAKAERKPAMRAYGTLPPADVDALVAYLLTLKQPAN